MNHEDFAGARCPVARSLGLFGDPWSLLIIRDAMSGQKRFGDFQKSLGTAENILAARLKKLVAGGVLEIVPGSGSFHEYALTEKGRDLSQVLVAIRQWGERSLFNPGELDLFLVDRENGEPVRPMELKAKDGRHLKPGEVEVVDKDE